MTTGRAAPLCKCSSPCAPEAGGFLVKQRARQQKTLQPKPAHAEQDNASEGGGECGSLDNDAHGEDAGGSGTHHRAALAGNVSCNW